MASKKSTTTAIAVMGSGEVEPGTIDAQLTDYLTKFENVTFILPLLDGEWYPGLRIVADWLIENDQTYEVITTADMQESRAFKPYVQNASTVLVRQRAILNAVVTRLREADAASFLALYDASDKTLDLILTKTLEAGIPALDLADGLAEITSEDSPEEDDEAAEEPVEAKKLKLVEHEGQDFVNVIPPQVDYVITNGADVDLIVELVLAKIAAKLVAS